MSQGVISMVKALTNKKKIKSKINFKKLLNGFTIVELAVTIVIIGILATITVVSYGSWQKNIRETQIKSELTSAKAAMENWRSFNGKYPYDISVTGYKQNSEVLVKGGSDMSGSNFTLSGKSLKMDIGGEFVITNATDAVFVSSLVAENVALFSTFSGGSLVNFFSSTAVPDIIPNKVPVGSSSVYKITFTSGYFKGQSYIIMNASNIPTWGTPIRYGYFLISPALSSPSDLKSGDTVNIYKI